MQPNLTSLPAVGTSAELSETSTPNPITKTANPLSNALESSSSYIKNDDHFRIIKITNMPSRSQSILYTHLLNHIYNHIQFINHTPLFI